MVFTKTGRVIAWIAVVAGLTLTAAGLGLALEGDDTTPYFGRRSTGSVIDQGLRVFIFGIVLGIFTEISTSLSAAYTRHNVTKVPSHN